MNQKREASFVFLAGKVSFCKDSNSRDGTFCEVGHGFWQIWVHMQNRDGKVENCLVLQELVTTLSLKAPRFLINHISKFSQLEGKSNSMIAAVFPARSRSSVLYSGNIGFWCQIQKTHRNQWVEEPSKNRTSDKTALGAIGCFLTNCNCNNLQALEISVVWSSKIASIANVVAFFPQSCSLVLILIQHPPPPPEINVKNCLNEKIETRKKPTGW